MKSVMSAITLLLLSAFGLSSCYSVSESASPPPNNPPPQIYYPPYVPPSAPNEGYYGYGYRNQVPGYMPAPQPYVQPSATYVPMYNQPPAVRPAVPGYVAPPPPQPQVYGSPAQPARPREQSPGPVPTPPPQQAPAPRIRR